MFVCVFVWMATASVFVCDAYRDHRRYHGRGGGPLPIRLTIPTPTPSAIAAAATTSAVISAETPSQEPGIEDWIATVGIVAALVASVTVAYMTFTSIRTKRSMFPGCRHSLRIMIEGITSLIWIWATLLDQTQSDDRSNAARLWLLWVCGEAMCATFAIHRIESLAPGSKTTIRRWVTETVPVVSAVCLCVGLTVDAVVDSDVMYSPVNGAFTPIASVCIAAVLCLHAVTLAFVALRAPRLSSRASLVVCGGVVASGGYMWWAVVYSSEATSSAHRSLVILCASAAAVGLLMIHPDGVDSVAKVVAIMDPVSDTGVIHVVPRRRPVCAASIQLQSQHAVPEEASPHEAVLETPPDEAVPHRGTETTRRGSGDSIELLTLDIGGVAWAPREPSPDTSHRDTDEELLTHRSIPGPGLAVMVPTLSLPGMVIDN